jgi:hypothetical protein
MISIARTLGAPLTVPAGNEARNTSIADIPSRSCPCTVLTMCSTWEYFSMTIRCGTTTVPQRATRPTSFLPRSSSIRCSARSLGSASRLSESRRSSSASFPRRRVPAMGRTVTIPSSSRTITSGDEPTSRMPSRSR